MTNWKKIIFYLIVSVGIAAAIFWQRHFLTDSFESIDDWFWKQTSFTPRELLRKGNWIRGLLLLLILAVATILYFSYCKKKHRRYPTPDIIERHIMEAMSSSVVRWALLIVLSIGIFLLLALLLGFANFTGTTLITLFGVLGGVATLIALGQIAWVRRHLELGVKTPDQFLNELSDVLDTVPNMRSMENGSHANNKSDFYYLCMVHDPLLVNILAAGNKRDHMARKRFLKTFEKVIHQRSCKKRVAMLSPMPATDYNQGKVIAYKSEFGANNNLLLAMESHAAWKALHVETNGLNSCQKTATLGSVGIAHPDNDRRWFGELAEKKVGTDQDQSFGNFDSYIKHSSASFRHLFCHDWEVADENEACLTFFGFMPEGLERVENLKNQFPHVNIFLSETKGLIAFFVESGSNGDYEIQSMPIHSRQMVDALKALFDGLVGDETKWHRAHLRRPIPPAATPESLAEPYPASTITSLKNSLPPETYQPSSTSPDSEPSQTTTLTDENNQEFPQ